MQVFFFAIGARDRASSRLRVWDHLDWAKAAGHSVCSDSQIKLGVRRPGFKVYLRIVLRFPRWVLNFFAADIVFIQESLILGPLLVFKDIGKKRKVIFDFSDPIDLAAGGLKGRLRNFMFRTLASRADALMFENRAYTARLGSYGKSLWHFYGPVNARRYGEARDLVNSSHAELADPLRLIWTGSPATFSFIHPILSAVDKFAAEQPTELVLIGIDDPCYKFHHAVVYTHPWDENLEFSLLAQGAIGLFRLPPTDDALLRGAGKLFIYYAAGVIPLATNLGIAKDVLSESGIGIPVDDDSDWLRQLRNAARALADDPNLSSAARHYAEIHLSYEAYRKQLSLLFATEQ